MTDTTSTIIGIICIVVVAIFGLCGALVALGLMARALKPKLTPKEALLVELRLQRDAWSRLALTIDMLQGANVRARLALLDEEIFPKEVT